MKINKVTLTGPDNKTSFNQLLNLQQLFPFVEWGILFSKSKEGQQRYPTQDHIENEFTGPLKLSAHFCGWYAKEVLENQNFDLITRLSDQFKRVQLNYNFKNSTGWNLVELLKYAEQHKGIEIILQYNQSNKETLDKFHINNLPSNFHFLYDSSGGRGNKIKTIEDPIGSFYTGYSGGLDTENIDDICVQILTHRNPLKVWIDMESGIRTNDEFDIDKARIILEKCDALFYKNER